MIKVRVEAVKVPLYELSQQEALIIVNELLRGGPLTGGRRTAVVEEQRGGPFSVFIIGMLG